MIRILLVDDQTLLCEVLKTWLEVEEDFQVVGVAHNGREAIDKVEQIKPHVVLMDIDMPQMDGLNATKIICQHFPEVKVIFLSSHDDDAYLGKSLRAGAKGYLLKNTTAEELALKIRSVHNASSVNEVESSESEGSIVALQTELEELIATYRHKFQKQLEEFRVSATNTDLEELDRKYEIRLEELERSLQEDRQQNLSSLEQTNQANWESIRKEIINVNSQFNQANRNLSTQFNQQLANLKKDLDVQIADALSDWSRQRAALQEWAVQRDEMRPSMEEYELKHRNELMSVVNPIRASFRDVDSQLKTMRNWLVASGLFALLSFCFSGYLLVSNARGNSSANISVEQPQ